jgi:hypothetical protein
MHKIGRLFQQVGTLFSEPSWDLSVAVLDQQASYSPSTVTAEDSKSGCFRCRCYCLPRVQHCPSSDPLHSLMLTGMMFGSNRWGSLSVAEFLSINNCKWRWNRQWNIHIKKSNFTTNFSLETPSATKLLIEFFIVSSVRKS